MLRLTPRAGRRLAFCVLLGLAALTLFIMFARLDEVVHLSGKLVADRHAWLIHAPSHGMVTEVLTAVGEHVEKNAPLLALDPNLSPEGLAEQERRTVAQQQDREHVEKARLVVTQLLESPDKVRTVSLSALGVMGETFNMVNELYAARLELDNATEYKRINVGHQRSQLASEVSLVQRNIELLKRNLETSKKATQARESALQAKRHDFETLMKLADKGLVSATDVNRERDVLLQAELALSDTHKQVDQIELDMSNRSLHISELKIRSEAVEEDANNRLSAAKLRYELRLARLAEHKLGLDRDLHALEAHALLHPKANDEDAHPKTKSIVISSPTAGIVTKLSSLGVGEEVQIGAHLVTVQPDGTCPVAMVEVSPLDALRIRKGQVAQVHIDAYPARRFGTIEGRVDHVFAQSDGATFAATIRLSRATLKVAGIEAALLPNFTVHADVRLGERRPVDLLFQP